MTVPKLATFAFMRQHPAHWIAMGLGAGLPRWAPGTVGTLWAWASFLLLNPWLTPAAWAAILLVGFFIGWWACTRTAQHLGIADPGCIVWDEILAFWLVLLLVMPAGFWTQLAAFALFRFFDAAKPQPVRWADRAFKGQGWRGGFGIIFDDLVAAFCALLVLALWQTWAG
ncbi:MAG: phosphatidylglycerophosphatase A [Brachymonas sp.]